MGRGRGELTRDRVDRAQAALRDPRYDRSRRTIHHRRDPGADQTDNSSGGSYAWNGDWDDLEQVRPYFEQFKSIKDGEGLFYNDDFRGRIDGLAGPFEDRGIYLLQKLHRQERNLKTIAEALANGHHELASLPEADRPDRSKFSSIYVLRDGGQQIFRYEQARIVFDPRTGMAEAILPKGKRTRGYRIYSSDRLVVRK